MNALIVDDHPIARRGLRLLLDEALAPARVVELGDGTRAVETARALQPQLVLLDLQVPGPPTADVLCAQLSAAVRRARIAIVTAHEDVPRIRRCLAAGAGSCLLKDTSELDMAAALRGAAAGERVIDPRIAQRLAVELVDVLRGGATAGRLTDRERDVLALLAEGCSNRLIAERLTIAETTAKGYVSALLRKLGARSRLEAVVKAAADGLL